ncbi:MAG: tetratricopeptide repeat protein [Planctomycetota bacterium]|jgi:tetratricopeptide (TPR) repeat protein
MAYRRGDEGPAAIFYKVYGSYYPETPSAIRRFVHAIEAQTDLPLRGVSTWPTDPETVAETAQSFASAASNLFFAELNLESDDATQLDRFALEFLIDPELRKMFKDGEFRTELADEYAAIQEAETNRVAEAALLHYAMGCFWGEWLARHTPSSWFLHAPLDPVQSFPDMLRTGTMTALSPFSLVTKLLTNPAESLASKVAAMPEQTVFGPVALCASISDSEEILRELVGPAVPKATQLLKEGKVDDAFRILDDAVDSNPENGHLLHQVSVLAWKHQQFALIHRATFLQLKIAPESAEIRHNFAAIESMREGGLDSAIGTLEQLVDEDPDYARARLTLASTYLEANRADEAKQHAQWVVENDPDLAKQAQSLLNELA